MPRETIQLPVAIKPDIDRMQRLLESSIVQMNAAGQRFKHPMGARVGGIWGNTLYKFQHSDSIWEAPLGPLFARIYGVENYKNIQECYGQAEIVLRDLRSRLQEFTQKWDFGMVDTPGHYWCAARGHQIHVHMDAWKEQFWISKELEDGVWGTASFQTIFSSR